METNPPYKCEHTSCSLITNDMGELDQYHIYCPKHNDGTIIHLAWRDPVQCGGRCGKCGLVVSVRNKDSRVSYMMKRPANRGSVLTFVPAEQVHEVEQLGYTQA